VRVISLKKLRDFWKDPKYPSAETPLPWWYQQVCAADWVSPADVKQTFNSVDFVGRKAVFNVGGNKFRVIAVIDFEGHKVFLRFVLDHKEYDKGIWQTDTFGDNWVKRRKGLRHED
jgi:mRNA interferase HigB